MVMFHYTDKGDREEQTAPNICEARCLAFSHHLLTVDVGPLHAFCLLYSQQDMLTRRGTVGRGVQKSLEWQLFLLQQGGGDGGFISHCSTG